jgi:hypothetical protein
MLWEYLECKYIQKLDSISMSKSLHSSGSSSSSNLWSHTNYAVSPCTLDSHPSCNPMWLGCAGLCWGVPDTSFIRFLTETSTIIIRRPPSLYSVHFTTTYHQIHTPDTDSDPSNHYPHILTHTCTCQTPSFLCLVYSIHQHSYSSSPSIPSSMLTHSPTYHPIQVSGIRCKFTMNLGSRL